MKGVFKRGRVFWYRFTFAGQQHRVSLETEDEIEAITAAREIRDNPQHFGIEVRDSWGEAVKRFIAAKKREGHSANTLYSYNLHLMAAARDMEVEAPHELSKHKVDKWLTWRLKNRSQRAAIHNFKLLDRFYRHLIETRRAKRNPCEGITVPKEKPSPRKRFLTKAECSRLLSVPCEDSLRFALYCGLHAGLRKIEVVQARPEWFDLEAGLLHIQSSKDWQPKDGDNRTVPLTGAFQTFLKGYGKPSPWMLKPDATGGTWRYRYDFRTQYRSHLKKCKIEGANFHDLRRTFASQHVSAGTSIYKVARWLGDGVGVVERHYGHLSPADSEINNAWD